MSKKTKIDPATGLPMVNVPLVLPVHFIQSLKAIAKKRSCSLDEVFNEAVAAYVEHIGYPGKSRLYGPDITVNDLYVEAIEFYLEHRKQIQ